MESWDGMGEGQQHKIEHAIKKQQPVMLFNESKIAVARKKKIQHFYCIFLFVLNAVLNTDLLGSSSLELFQMDMLEIIEKVRLIFFFFFLLTHVTYTTPH